MAKVHKDFHGALSCAFQFLDERYGKEVLEKFLRRVGKNCYKDLISSIPREGFSALEKYWKGIFTLEEGEFDIKVGENFIVLEVKKCPALSHLRETGYPIYRDFCYQTEVINSVIAEEANLGFKVEGYQNEACCIQRFWRKI